jgi:hypothetical protein
MYGDADRQVASIIRQNSENIVNSVPKISVYVSELSLDRNRLSDSSFVGKVHFRERDIQVDADTGRDTYNQSQGRNYTVERVMPTPFKLTMKIDIWSANTDQKLQIMEQLLVLFNPSLELQTTDNYIDWTSLTTLELTDVKWSSRPIPVGNDSPIEIATLTVVTPIWISPPAKVKHLGVITKIITSFYQDSNTSPSGYIDGLGQDLAGPTTTFSTVLARITETTSGNFGIQVYGGEVRLMAKTENAIPKNNLLELPVKQGPAINWEELFAQFPQQYVAGSSRLFLTQSNGSNVIGTILINPLDNTLLNVSWDPDTLTTNTGIDSNGYLDTDIGYSLSGCYRANSPGTFDAIMDPLVTGPNDVKFVTRYGALAAGRRYLIIEDIGGEINTDGADAWKSTTNVDFVAHANDIIEWSGTAWSVIFNSIQETDTMVWQTNIYTGVQYLWNGVSWIKSFEGEYKAGEWTIEL